MYHSSTGKWNLAFKRSDLGENLGAIGSAEVLTPLPDMLPLSDSTRRHRL
jgi:hypothetical protein